MNGKTIRDEFIYGMITNSVSVGGMKNMTGSNVKLDDGEFEVTLMQDAAESNSVKRDSDKSGDAKGYRNAVYLYV